MNSPHDLAPARRYTARHNPGEDASRLQFLTRFDRYLARLILVPLFASLVIAAMLLLLDKMLRLFDFVMNEGGPVSVVWKMLGNLLPEYLSLGIPIGVLLGILLAFRGLALSSELDALRAVGISYNRLLRVPLLFATLFAAVNFGVVGFLQPYSRYAYEGLQFELRSGALGASIKVGEFARLGKGITLRVEESHAKGSDLRGLFVRAAGNNGQIVAATADHGTFLATDDPDVILLRLNKGTLVHNADATSVPRVLSFDQHDLPVNLPAMGAFRARGNAKLELTLPELVRTSRDPATPPADRLQATATLHRRLIECVVMFVLPFLGVAMAVPPKRSTSALGVFLSVILLVSYHKVSEYGERMGALGRVDPVLAQWLPFALFAALSLWLYYVLAYKPGGQPIGALERIFAKLGGALGKLFRRLRPQPKGWADDPVAAG